MALPDVMTFSISVSSSLLRTPIMANTEKPANKLITVSPKHTKIASLK